MNTMKSMDQHRREVAILITHKVEQVKRRNNYIMLTDTYTGARHPDKLFDDAATINSLLLWKEKVL